MIGLEKKGVIAVSLMLFALALFPSAFSQPRKEGLEPLPIPQEKKVERIFEYGRFGVNIRLGGGGQMDMNKLEQLFVESGTQWEAGSAYYQASVPFMQTVDNPGPNQTYNWKHLDGTVTNRAKQNIRTLIILGPYNHQKNTRMPSDLESWKAFVREVVKRCSEEMRGGVRYFALNNEPSVPQYWNDTPENYAILLRATYEAAKEVNPKVKMVLGSMPADVVVNQPSQQDFFPTVLKYRFNDGTTAEDYFDIFDIHVYDEPSTFKKYVDYAKSLMIKNKPMIMTETASTSHPQYAGIKGQAQDVVKRFVTAFGVGIEAVTWQPFSDHTPLGVPANVADRFAQAGFLEEHILNPKPSYYTFKLMIEKLDKFSAVEQLGEGRFKFIFADKNPVFVLWDQAGQRSVDLSSSLDSEKALISHIIEEPGQTRPETETVSSREIPVSESPIFLEQAGQ